MDEDQPIGEHPDIPESLHFAIRLSSQLALFRETLDNLIDSFYSDNPE